MIPAVSHARRLRRPLAGLLAAALAIALLPGPVAAQTGPELVATGWWWRAQTGLLVPAPTPPQVPEGGLMVAGAPDGAVARAAVRYELGPDETGPVLTLRVASDSGGEQARLAACLSGSPWTPADGGRWDFAPSAACAQGSVMGVRSDDGSTWTFPLEPLLIGGLLDVVLVPGKVDGLPEGADGSTFELVFEPPTSASLTTLGGSPPSGGGFDAPSIEEFSPPDPEPAGEPAPGDGGFAAPGPPSTPGPAAFEPSLDEEDQEFTAIAPSRERLSRPPPVEPVAQASDPTLLAMLVLLAGAAAAVATSRQPLPAPQRLGRFGAAPGATGAAGAAGATEPVTGGLGRFARPRTGPPPGL